MTPPVFPVLQHRQESLFEPLRLPGGLDLPLGQPIGFRLALYFHRPVFADCHLEPQAPVNVLALIGQFSRPKDAHAA
jgi:hypothetical protein